MTDAQSVLVVLRSLEATINKLGHALHNVERERDATENLLHTLDSAMLAQHYNAKVTNVRVTHYRRR
jgi:hypothetical protein